MLTKKQRWRRICGASRASNGVAMARRSESPGPSPPPLWRSQLSCPPNMMRPPLDSLTVGDSLLHLMRTSGKAIRTDDHSCASGSQQKVGPRVRGRVNFNLQVRVVLVPSRSELERLKTDIWWGNEDYLSFRREYVSIARANIEKMRATHALRVETAAEAAKVAREWAEHKHKAPFPGKIVRPSTLLGSRHGGALCARASQVAPLAIATADAAQSPPCAKVGLVGSQSTTSVECPVEEGVAEVKPDVIRQVKPWVGTGLDKSPLMVTATELHGNEGRESTGRSPSPVILTQHEATSPEAVGTSVPPVSPASKFFSAFVEDENECRTQAMSSFSGRTDVDSDIEDETEDEAEDEAEKETGEDVDLLSRTPVMNVSRLARPALFFSR